VEERTADLFSTDKRLTGEIEKRSSAENELWKSHEFLLSVIESAPSLMLIYDASTRQCLYVNGRIVDLLGYTPEEVCLQGSDFFRTVLEREDYLSFVKSHTSAQTGVSTSIMDGPHRLRHASGDWRRCYLKSTVLAGTSDDLPREMLLTAIESDR
ncbi:MAG: PAS domain-containing protein, partial [Thermoanaerobaculia bacterium]